MPTRRIALNTIATYMRTLFAVGLALFGSRWVLNALGVSDYGLFSVMGSLIAFITFLNGLLATSAARYYAYSIGVDSFEEVTCWFNSALAVHLCLAFILIIIGWPAGGYIVQHFLTIPDNRVSSCVYVFHISLVSAFVSMISVPFTAMFTAKQRISELAGWGMAQSALTFTLAFLLCYAPGDRLLFYASGMVTIIVFIQAAQILRAITVFEECRLVGHHWFDCQRLRQIFTFAGWNLIGYTGVLFRDQGSAILLNLFFGPSVNAAYGIATQVSNQTNQLSAAMIGAFAPEIASCEGRGDRSRMLSLSQRASKFGTILILLLAIPLMAEMDYVLRLWLHEPPPYTAIFCQMILGTFIIDRLSTGYMLAVQARGNIAAYQVTVGTTLLLTLPLAWLLLKFGFAPASIGIAFVITMSVTSFGRVLWGRHYFDISIKEWLGVVVKPAGIIAFAGTLGAFAPRLLMPSSFLRFLTVLAATIIVSSVTGWHLALDEKEREFVLQSVRKVMGRFLTRDQAEVTPLRVGKNDHL